MPLLQVQIEQKLKTAIQKKAKLYNVPASSLVKIALAQSFLQMGVEKKPFKPGNIFNADRDSEGRGIKLDDFIKML